MNHVYYNVKNCLQTLAEEQLLHVKTFAVTEEVGPKRTLYYLAGPYTSSDSELVEGRVQKINEIAADLIATGHYVLCPNSMGHAIVKAAKKDYLPTDWAFWKGLDERLLEACDVLLVLTLPGWDISVGVQAEIAFAIHRGMPVFYLDLDEEDGGYYVRQRL